MSETGVVETEALTAEELVAAVRGLAPAFRESATAAEEARALPPESAAALLDSGIARALVPRRWGGAELGLDAWFEIVHEVSKADASHGWCAGLLVHLPHFVALFPEEGQAAVWAGGPNVAIAGSVLPVCEVTPENGGYRVSGKSPFSSGVEHSSWVFVGGMVPGDGPPQWTFFLIPPGEYEVIDTWHTTGMRATGSNTIVTEDAFVPAGRVLALSDLVEGTAPGGAIHDNPMYRLPFMSFAPVGFAATMLGAARGAYEEFRTWTSKRRTADGSAVAEIASVQVRMSKAAADLDAAELLLRRAVAATQGPERPSLEGRARTMRDAARAAETIAGAVDELVAMSGTAGFASSNPIQRAWRDVHFAASHVSLNPEVNCAHWGRTELGVERPPTLLMY
jgi:3-hydroxy-9,10-secoandrosta-1,3,5(10)-triene-9,17-dione monooxygenase